MDTRTPTFGSKLAYMSGIERKDVQLSLLIKGCNSMSPYNEYVGMPPDIRICTAASIWDPCFDVRKKNSCFIVYNTNSFMYLACVESKSIY